jgi:lipoate---protein ligase
MYYSEVSASTPERNLALDEALLIESEEGKDIEVLRVWEAAAPFIVLGCGCKAASDIRSSEGVSAYRVLRRVTGGGTVLQAPGCLNYALVLSIGGSDFHHNISATNRFVMERLREAFQTLAPQAVAVCGTSDLTLEGRKFSGNAQKRCRRFLLFHGTCLYNFDIGAADRVLSLPDRRPDYRGSRLNSSFLTNLPAARGEIAAALRAAWDAQEPLAELPPQTLLERLERERYDSPAWNLRF